MIDQLPVPIRKTRIATSTRANLVVPALIADAGE